MKMLLQLSRCFVLLSALFTFAQAADEKPEAIGLPAGTVIVPDGLKAADVQQSILLAGTGRGWTVKDRADGKVVLFLEQGGWRSQLTLTYDTKEIQIVSNSGKTDRNGVIKKPAIPESWVKYLKQDLNKHLGAKAFGK